MTKNENQKVCVCYVHRSEVSHSWAESMMQLLVADIATGITISEVLKLHGATGMVDDSRNVLVEEFLSRGDEWLFFIDDDMGFKPDTLRRLLERADPDERPVMGALAFTSKEIEFDGYFGYRTQAKPTLLDETIINNPAQDGELEVFLSRGWYEPGSVVKCGATGMACIVIHRSVFEKMGGKHFRRWFNRSDNPDGSRMGEDISFCKRCAEHDIPIHVHTGIKTTHKKEVWIQEQDFWEERDPPPAGERCVVIVPVLHRPQNADLFMRSLRASTGLCDVVAVADEGDDETMAAWLKAGAIVLKGPEHTFAEKVNRAYRDTREWPVKAPWIFMVGDDVHFRPGWLDHAQWMAYNTDKSVIGTNDLGNARVMSGEHGTHLLISTAYIDYCGASWDGPSNVCHEGYNHWFVDDEIVTAAKLRNEWVSALGSYVEHLHPLWEKGKHDAVYEEGESHAQEDKTLWLERLAEHTGAEL